MLAKNANDNARFLKTPRRIILRNNLKRFTSRSTPFAEFLPAQRQRCLESTCARGLIARLWITRLSTEKTKNNDEPSPSRIVIYSE